jgi:hypothetical protein
MGFVEQLQGFADSVTKVAGDVERGARAVQGAVSGASGGAGAAVSSYRPPAVTAVATPGLAPDQGVILMVGGVILLVVILSIMRR